MAARNRNLLVGDAFRGYPVHRGTEAFQMESWLKKREQTLTSRPSSLCTNFNVHNFARLVEFEIPWIRITKRLLWLLLFVHLWEISRCEKLHERE